MVRRRYRLRFCKKGNLCFIGHRDLLRAMERLLRRAELPVAASEGFHPKPKVSYFSALPLGYSSDDEAMELVLDEDLNPETLLARLNAASVDGLRFLAATALAEKAPKAQAVAFVYEATIPTERTAAVSEKIAEFLASESVEVVKTNGKTVDARSSVLELGLAGTTLRAKFAAQTGGPTGPEAGFREILGCLGVESELFRTIFPNRCETTIKER